MSYVDMIADIIAAACFIIGATGIVVSISYSSKATKTPLTEAMWAAGLGQMGLGMASLGMDGAHVLRMSFIALSIALAQYRILGGLRERASDRAAT